MSTPLRLKRKKNNCGRFFLVDIFALTHSDMTGISLAHASHKMNVIPSARPVKKKGKAFPPKLPSDYSGEGRQSFGRRVHQGS